MSGTTVGQFLREKLVNMSAWLQAEGVNGAGAVTGLQEIQIVAMAQHLHNNYLTALHDRDFSPLRADTTILPIAMLKVLQDIETRPDLHDKFWRYLKLFSDTVSVHE